MNLDTVSGIPTTPAAIVNGRERTLQRAGEHFLRVSYSANTYSLAGRGRPSNMDSGSGPSQFFPNSSNFVLNNPVMTSNTIRNLDSSRTSVYTSSFARNLC